MRKKTSRSPGKGSGFRKLFRTENPVAGVAQAGNDVLMLIELFVHRADINLYVRMSFLQSGKTFRRCNNAHKAHAFGAFVFDLRDSVDGGTSGG